MSEGQGLEWSSVGSGVGWLDDWKGHFETEIQKITDHGTIQVHKSFNRSSWSQVKYLSMKMECYALEEELGSCPWSIARSFRWCYCQGMWSLKGSCGLHTRKMDIKDWNTRTRSYV